MLVVLAAACTEYEAASTEVLVVVRSELEAADELDAVEVRAVGPDGSEKRAGSPLDVQNPLPKSVSLVHTGGPLAPLQVVVSGWKEGREVVTRSARLSFLPDRRLVLDVWLLRACVGAICAEGTCTEHGCASDAVDPETLPTFTGSAHGVEARDAQAPQIVEVGASAPLRDAAAQPVNTRASGDASVAVHAATGLDGSANSGTGTEFAEPTEGLDAALPTDGGVGSDATASTGASEPVDASKPIDASEPVDASKPADAETSVVDAANRPGRDGCAPSDECLRQCLAAPERLRFFACACTRECR